MKKTALKVALFLVIGLVASACSKKSADNNNGQVPPNNGGYVPPINGGNRPNNPPNNYCACINCGCSGGGNYWPGGNWGWDDNDNGYNPPHHDDNDDDSCDNASASFDSGWKKMWGTMDRDGHGNRDEATTTFTVPKCGVYYISFKGNYTGCDQIWEHLQVAFESSNGDLTNVKTIKDLNDTHRGSGEVTETCKVATGFRLRSGKTYTLWLGGIKDKQSSVNQTYLKITGAYPSSSVKKCN